MSNLKETSVHEIALTARFCTQRRTLVILDEPITAGAVAGMAEALAKYGTLSLAAVMTPAIRLAKYGFLVDSALFRSLRGNRAVPQYCDACFTGEYPTPLIDYQQDQADKERQLSLLDDV